MQGIFKVLGGIPGVLPAWRRLKIRSPRTADRIYRLAAVCYALLARLRIVGHAPAVVQAGPQYAVGTGAWQVRRGLVRRDGTPLLGMERLLRKWLIGWPELQGLDFENLMRNFRFTCDRFILPMILLDRWFVLKKYDSITEIGTDRFDACLFFDDDDTQAHKILFGNPNMYTVRSMWTVEKPQTGLVNAVLVPFSGHSAEDMRDEIFDLYARDLSIVLKATGAAEAHIRPHPALKVNYPELIVDAVNKRGVPCRLASAERSITEEASRYRGVVGAVSGSLRDVYMACPHVFVVGSVALSIIHVPDPKRIIGFRDGIGWIEADGTFDENIFRPSQERSARHPTLVEVIDALHRGEWSKTPSRLAHKVRPMW